MPESSAATVVAYIRTRTSFALGAKSATTGKFPKKVMRTEQGSVRITFFGLSPRPKSFQRGVGPGLVGHLEIV